MVRKTVAIGDRHLVLLLAVLSWADQLVNFISLLI